MTISEQILNVTIYPTSWWRDRSGAIDFGRLQALCCLMAMDPIQTAAIQVTENPAVLFGLTPLSSILTRGLSTSVVVAQLGPLVSPSCVEHTVQIRCRHCFVRMSVVEHHPLTKFQMSTRASMLIW